MLKLANLTSFFERCERIMREYNIAYSSGEETEKWDEKKTARYFCGPIKGLYLEKDSELLSYLRQDCDENELYELIKMCIDESNNHPMKLIGIEKGYLTPTPYPNKAIDLKEWLNKYNYLYSDALIESDKKYVLSFFFLQEGLNKYKKEIQEREFLEDSAIIGIYGNLVKSNYNLIPVEDNIELLGLNPARIYDSRMDKTIYVDISKKLASVLILLKEKGFASKIFVKGIGTAIYDGKLTQEAICEEVEKGSIFSLSKVSGLPNVTKLYSQDYENQLWVAASDNELTFEELCGDFVVQAGGIRTQMIHLQFSVSEKGILINHIDHEYIYYSLEEYDDRKSDGKMRTKGSIRKRIKTFKVDKAQIPMDYPCTMFSLNSASEEYEEVSVPFLLFVIDTFFTHKDLIEEYFAEF